MNWSDLSVLVTGGTGSFGKKFAEIMLRKYHPKKLIIFSRDELKQHEMRQVYPDTDDSPMRYFTGDVRDKERLRRAMNGVDIVVHAAALKQVPACEYNPFEAVKTNVLGAQNVIETALDAGVRQSVKNPWVYLNKRHRHAEPFGGLRAGLLELCRTFGVKKFVQASTSSLYGANNPRPFPRRCEHRWATIALCCLEEGGGSPPVRY